MTTPIRKSLLTPYRRIGLSRNKKPLNNGSFISPFKTADIKLITDDVLPINARISKAKTCDEVPSISIACNKQKQHSNEGIKVNVGDSSIPIVLNENKNKIKTRKDDSKKKDNITKENIETETKIVKTNQKKKQENKKNYKREQIQVSDTNENTPELENKKINMSDKNCNRNKSTSSQECNITELKTNHKGKTKRKKYVLDSDDDNDSDFSGFPSSGSSDKSATHENSRNEDFEIKKRKRMNTVDLQHNSKNNITQKTDFRNDLINGEILNNIEINETKPKPKSNKTIKRKFSLSLKKSTSDSTVLSDEEESVRIHKKSDANTLENKENSDIIEEILKLEKTVQNKEDQLHKLKQAEIYRNLHKLGDLKFETDVWKSGCKNALRDLLKSLNQHSAIDMNTMLANLKIPQNMFKYDVDNDCFYE